MEEQNANEKMRVHKYLSASWVCSRRKAEDYISRWLVTINWEIATIWQSIISWVDKVELQNEAVKEQKSLVYFILNKPRGIVTTCAQTWDKTILDLVDIKERVFPVWRLDKETTWLIMLTNDWRLANYLMHPKYDHEKEYIVEVFWPIEDRALEKMSEWIFILWSYTKPARIKRISSWKFSITISEWRNRQIRRMVEKVWGTIKKLKRIRIENIKLWQLDTWEYREVTDWEKYKLFKKLDIK